MESAPITAKSGAIHVFERLPAGRENEKTLESWVECLPTLSSRTTIVLDLTTNTKIGKDM
jgi:hypothetical protein